jgi:protein-tyrosine-phosphatase
MRMWRGIVFLVLLGALAAPASAGKLYVLWTNSALPPARTLGVSDLVIPWSEQAKSLMEGAKRQGYRVYLEATLEKAPAAAESGVKAGVAGIILKPGTSEGNQPEEIARQMRSAFPKLKILVLSARGKQPDMRGWLVFKKDGILQVSSPTSQPWLDANLAMIRYEKALQTTQAPLYTFSWDLTDPLVKEHGPSAANYALAVAEAGAFHADLILEVHERQQKGLASGEKETLSDWKQVKRTIEFYAHGNYAAMESGARVGVLTDDYESSYEALNLMARHNIPYRVLRSAEVKAQDLEAFDVVIAFAALGKELTERIGEFAARGGLAVVVNLPGAYPWDTALPEKKSAHSVTYKVGKGSVIELGEAITDPETFAQDVRRLMVKPRIPVSLWNSLTTLVVAYRGAKAGEAVVELVNYDEEPTQVQVQVKGTFASVRYESPERGCCEALKPAHVDGFTEFVVPDVVIGGRAHLEAARVDARSNARSKD